MKKIMLLICCLLISRAVLSGNLVLVEFDASEYDSTLIWLAELESCGVSARHIFPPNRVILDIHG